MKKHEVVRHMESHACYKLRDRGKHTIYVNPANNQNHLGAAQAGD
jgi:hypothetical protein